ncbi:hypothetical protein B0E52_11865 [Rhodanobacter sp. C06]|uniref:sulfite exporter TauE/SafE family protein n=1 Tax=Rhodanobacter sp. C06 TaxID=1945854 RepID=UPI0009861548|nr:sulfite exporter TauE/SafE family protein [Rhodanobacter sp. C06]OOG40070.1 hypothetical protein B0E52_11865 [Rhodanobacter sp. C06]
MLPADLLALACGGLVGFSLALIGGGGSILATPMLLYVVGLPDPHLAIGTSAVAVGANAWANLIPHARAGHVRWPAALAFAAAGVLGAFAGSTLGKRVDGHHLLVLFAVLMLVVAVLMLRGRRNGAENRYPKPRLFPRLGATGFGAGALAGFFGIGGGFLIVPGLIFASGMEIIAAVGSSLVAVGAFASTTAINYATSGLVDWRVAALFVAGGIVGGWLGARLARRLARTRGALNLVFALAIVAVAVYMLVRNLHF